MKKIISALSILGLTTVLLLNQGCYYDKAELLNNGTICDTTTSTYSLRVKPIIDSRCNACHSTNSNSSGILLDSYSALKAYAGPGGKLLPDIKQIPGTVFNAMPQGSSKLSDCNIAIIEAWINAGMPQ